MAKKFAERTKTITFSPFPYTLTLVVSTDIRQSIANRIAKHNLDEPSEDMEACIYALPHGKCLMFLSEDADLEYIVHECSHVIWYMLRYAGVALDKEVLAYFTGNLSSTVALFVWHPQKRKKFVTK